MNQSQFETPCSLATPDCPTDNQSRQPALFLYGTLPNIIMMQKLTTILVILCSVLALKAQNSPNNFRFGVTASIDKNLSSETMAFDQYTGYSADYDKINYRLGLNLGYQLKQKFSINTAIEYSNKDFTRIYFCHVCDFSVLPSEDIDFRFIEVPLSVRYYLLPNKLGLFGEVGINNQFFLNGDLTDKSYALGVKLGAGLEYDFTQTLAFQFLVNYNRGVTNLNNESDFKLDYVGFGVGILKKI